MDRQISIYHSEVDVDEVSSILEGQMNDLPPISSRIVRVFISSTFSDTIEERNALMENVYPKLKDVCRDQHGVEFQAIDLRWGIRNESQDDHTTIDFCLREIENCQKASIGPSFVTFLGQKYGYRPFPPIINANQFEAIQQALRNDGKEFSLLHTWFKKDENVLPPVYNLVPVSSILVHYGDKINSVEKEADEQRWVAVFQEILQLLRDGVILAIKEGLLNVREKEKYFVSVTEYEIETGLLQLRNPSKSCLCFSRTITNLEDHLDRPLAPKFIDMEPDKIAIARQPQTLLRRLKVMKIPHAIQEPDNMGSSHIRWEDPDRSKLNEECDYLRQLSPFRSSPFRRVMKIPHAIQDPDNMGSFHIRWEDPDRSKPNEDRDYLRQFCDMFYEKMVALIGRSVAELSHVINDQYVVEILQHLNLCKTRQEVFRGRLEIIKRIKHYVSHDSPLPMVVYGESGSGKTSLLAKAACMVHGWFPRKRPVLLVRFLGTTARSSSLRLVLGSVCWQIGSIYGQDMKHLPLDCPGLVTYFHELLHLATEDHPLVIFLDSLDQLSSAYQAHTLTWLPKKLPPHVRLVVSTLPEYCEILDTLKDIVTNQRNFVEVLPLGHQMGQVVLQDWLKSSGRRLTSLQQGIVQKALMKCSLPLYTRLIFEEVCRWKSYTPVLQTQLQDCVTGILNVLFERVERYYGEKFVCHALSYLTASKNGLSDAELDDLLSLDDEVLNDVFIYWLPPVRRIPPLLWPRLHNELSSYITQREANATIVLYWYHRQFIEVAKQRYLSNVPHRIYIHSVLVHYYLGTWGGGRKKPFRYSAIQVQQLGLPKAESAADRKVPMQPLQFACEGQKKVRYNLRKLSELPYHLVNSRRVADLKREVLFNYDWLHAKITSMSLHDVLADFRFASQNDMTDQETGLLANMLRLCGSFVNRNPHTLAFDLLGRLLPYYDVHCNIRVLLQQCDTVSLRHSAIVPVFQCFEATKGMLRYILEDHKKTVRDLIFSKSTDELISVSLDGTIGFWDLTSGERTRTIDLSDLKFGNHSRLLQSGDGRYLICDSGENNSPVCIFNMKTSQLIHKVGKRSPNIRRVFCVGNLLCRQKSIINIKTGKVVCLLSMFTKSKKYVTCGITPNEKYILVGEEKHTNMFELRSGRLQASFPAENLPCMFAITPDSRLGYAGYTEDCIFKVFDIDPTSQTFGTVIIDFDAQTVFPEVLNSEGPRFGKELGEVAISPHNAHHIAMNIKRCHLVIFNVDRLSAKLMDMKEVLRGRIRSKVYLFGTMFNFDGSYLLAGMDRHLYIWDVDTGHVQRTISLHNTHRFPFAVSHEKNFAVTGSQGNTVIKVWNFDDRTPCAGAAQLRIYENPVDMMMGSHVDQCVYIKQYYGLVNANAYHYLDSFGIDVWNMNTGNCLTYLPFGQYGTLEQMSISPNGKKMMLLLGVRSDRFLTLIDLAENKLIMSVASYGCQSFVMSPCWDFAITLGRCNDETEMKLWNLKSEAEVECFTNCSSPVFIADGCHLVYIENGSLIVVYSLRTFVRLQTMHCIADRLQLIPNRPGIIMATMFPDKDVGDETPYSEVKVISFVTCKIVSRINYVSPRGIVDISKDGLVAIDSYLQAFDVRNGVIINDLAATVMGPRREYDLIRLTYDGKFAIWVDDLAVKVRSVADGKLVANVCTHEKPTSLELLEFGYLLVVGREDGHVLTMKLLHDRSRTYVNVSVPYNLEERTNMVLEKSGCSDKMIATFDPLYRVTPQKHHDCDFVQVSSDVQVLMHKQAKVPISITKTWSETDLKAAAAAAGSITPKRRLSSPMVFLHSVAANKSRDSSPKNSPVESPKDSPKMRTKAKEKSTSHDVASALNAIHKTGNLLMACVEAGSSLSLNRSPSPRMIQPVDMEQLHRHLQRTMDISKMS